MKRDPWMLAAVNRLVAILARCLKPKLLTASFLGIVMIGCAGYLGLQHGHEILTAMQRGAVFPLAPATPQVQWPPERHRVYPDLTLMDQQGNTTRLSDFKGKVILVEPVGMSCSACVSFSGGLEKGACGGVEPQPNLESIANYARRFGRLELDEANLIFVQIVLFNREMQAPSLEDIQEWATHFGFHREKNQIVLASTPALVNAASRRIIPGFQLIDKDFILRADSTGQHPADDLYYDLLPQLRLLIQE